MILVTEFKLDRLLGTCTATTTIGGRSVPGVSHLPLQSDGGLRPVDLRISLHMAFEWMLRDLTTAELESLYRLLLKK